jgi:hypothetical protein
MCWEICVVGGKYVLLCFNSPCREKPENAMEKRAYFLLIRPLAAPKKNEEAAQPIAGPKNKTRRWERPFAGHKKKA